MRLLKYQNLRLSVANNNGTQNQPAQGSKEKASLPKSGAAPGASIPSTPQLPGDCTHRPGHLRTNAYEVGPSSAANSA